MYAIFVHSWYYQFDKSSGPLFFYLLYVVGCVYLFLFFSSISNKYIWIWMKFGGQMDNAIPYNSSIYNQCCLANQFCWSSFHFYVETPEVNGTQTKYLILNPEDFSTLP